MADQFLVLRCYEDKQDLLNMQRKIDRDFMKREVLPDKHVMAIACGICCIEDTIEKLDIRGFVNRANYAQKTIKNAPGSNYAFYNESIREQMFREIHIADRMGSALAAGEFIVYFQPKVSLSQNRITGRRLWCGGNRPGSGVISPGEVYSCAGAERENPGPDRYVFEKVCIWLGERKRREQETFPVSVNLSRSNFIYDSFLEEFIEIADRHQADRNMIELEVTETVFLTEENIQKVKREIRAIHDCGFRCALDDFGVGFSSLTLLKEFNIDSLKMDRSFFSDLDNAKTRNVISCILELAEQLDMETVAEGIETEEQIDSLRRLGCDVVQGYYFSRPLPQEQFERWIQEFEEIHVREDRE